MIAVIASGGVKRIDSRAAEIEPGNVMRWMLLCLCLIVVATAAAEPVRVTDDTGRVIDLPAPAQRIVSLAPHVTELLFAAGAGERIVGTVSYSDYPHVAEDLPRVGSYKQLDFETILAMEPDLVVAWRSGNVRAQVERLEQLGFTIYYSEPRELDEIATAVERLARLAGTVDEGRRRAEAFRAEMRDLRDNYADLPAVEVFYQIWHQPLMTVNDNHIITRTLELCGGRNAFGHLQSLTPRLGKEAVLENDPEVIIASGMGEDRPDWLSDWRAFPNLTAVQRDNLYFVPPSLLQRHAPRILQGARQVCEHLQAARAKRP
ncbi:MAG: cobalamin-binding protein [Aquisalimonadaceae bacterium]